MVQFFQSLFGNAGDFIVDAYNSLSSFVDFVPTWVIPIILGISTLIVVRIIINVI